jgi:hypothetical protein
VVEGFLLIPWYSSYSSCRRFGLVLTAAAGAVVVDRVAVVLADVAFAVVVTVVADREADVVADADRVADVVVDSGLVVDFVVGRVWAIDRLTVSALSVK